MDKASGAAPSAQLEPANPLRRALSLSDILIPERIRCNDNAKSKKRVLESMSELIASRRENLGQQAVFDCLIARERLGSTALGHGVALPHGRLASSPEMAFGDRAIGAFLKLRSAVDFDAPDGEKVDLVFGLLVPEESTDEHLQILARLAELFSNADVRDALRAPISPSDVHELLIHTRP